ncbi:MAG TPA: hypothetical protein VHZ50_16240 [Puia sp.]|jgi:hypothetical protein|nr:hypothetical protein [Puia sp.]
MKPLFPFLFLNLFISHFSFSQQSREDIYTNVVLYQNRSELEKDLRERVIAKTFSTPLDSNTEYKYETACEAISQFQFATTDVEQGFANLFERYDSLEYETKKSFLEAVYAVQPKKYFTEIQKVIGKETDPKLFSICAAYLFRYDPSINNSNVLKIDLVEKFPGYDTINILQELVNYLSYHYQQMHHSTPDIVQLFKYQKSTGQKIIYSFQRWNRDYPGIAIVQNANGSFVKDANGRLLIFQQLARSGSDLPYFITNGSTPQGIYSIQGTEISHNNFIGPTPNIQLIIPFENKWEKYFHEDEWNPANDSLKMYLQLLPAGWKNYSPMMEAWNAGKIGRTEIIAHGTTIDPEYFKDKPYYPLTPTEGCLCAKELWNITTGHLLMSEQFNLVSAFQSTTGNKGLLYVINIDNQQGAVTREQVEQWVRKFEKK